MEYLPSNKRTKINLQMLHLVSNVPARAAFLSALFFWVCLRVFLTNNYAYMHMHVRVCVGVRAREHIKGIWDSLVLDSHTQLGKASYKHIGRSKNEYFNICRCWWLPSASISGMHIHMQLATRVGRCPTFCQSGSRLEISQQTHMWMLTQSRECFPLFYILIN